MSVVAMFPVMDRGKLFTLCALAAAMALSCGVAMAIIAH
jgi:hypothetical protein